MKILISGISGFIGSALKKALEKENHHIVSLGRKEFELPEKDFVELFQQADAVVHLAGAPVIKRWTKNQKQKILDSRILTTQKISNAIQLAKMPENFLFIGASAIGIYNNMKSHTESSIDFDKGFLGKVCRLWEQASESIPNRRIIMRIGLVLDKKGGSLKPMLPLFRLGLGGSMGNGKQAFPFIHRKDIILFIVKALENKNMLGVYNLVAPQQISQRDFAMTLGKKLRRPSFIPTPAFALRLLFGKAAMIILNSPVVQAEKLIKEKFHYKYPTINDCLNDIIE